MKPAHMTWRRRLSAALKRLSNYLRDENKTFTMALVASVFLWWPVFVPSKYVVVIPLHTDEAYVLRGWPVYQEAVTAVAYVTIPTLVDSLLDLAMVAFERLGVRVSTKHAMSKDADVSSVEVSDVAKVKTTRLTAFERLVFLVGVALPSIVVLGAPSTLNNDQFYLIYVISSNVRNVVVTISVMVFLQRCTASWTPLSVAAMISLVFFGSLIAEFGYLFGATSAPRALVHWVGLGLGILAVLLFLITCCLCLYRSTNLWAHLSPYIVLTYGQPADGAGVGAPDGSSGDDRRHGVMYPRSHKKQQSFTFGFGRKSSDPPGSKRHNNSGKEDEEMEEDHIQRKIKAIDAFYENAVPAAHMTSMLLLAFAELLPYIYRGSFMALYGISGFLVLLLVVIIIFIENRVRHNEVERTLLRMVSSVKKSYVRYLSHELRTPLNTTWLGIKLLSDEANAADEDERDEDQIEILNSMGTACKTAVDILDNMIQFDKLESGILTLRKEPVQVRSFVTDCAAVFSTEARHLGVDLRVMLDVSPQALRRLDEATAAQLQPRHGGRSALAETVPAAWRLTTPVRETDFLAADRTKLESVVCNLISHALKSCPNGASITVAAWFVPDEEDTGADGGASSGSHVSLCGPCMRGLATASGSTKATRSGDVRKTYTATDRSSLNPSGPVKCPGRLVVMVTDVDLVDNGSFRPGGPPPVGLNRAAGSSSNNTKSGRAPSGTSSALPSLPTSPLGDGNGNDTATTPTPPRVQVDVSRFNPKKLVAGGGDGMSLWISRGVVDLHGGQVLLYVPAADVENAVKAHGESTVMHTARRGSTQKAGEANERRSIQSSHIVLGGQNGKTVVVELPMTRVLTPDDQIKQAKLEAFLAARQTKTDGHATADDVDVDVDVDALIRMSDTSSVSTIAGVSSRGFSQNGLLVTARKDSREVPHDWLPRPADAKKDDYRGGPRAGYPTAATGTSTPTAAASDERTAGVDETADSSRREEMDVVEIVDDDAFGVPSRRLSHNHDGGPRRVSAGPVRRGSAWVVLDEDAAVARRASRSIIGMGTSITLTASAKDPTRASPPLHASSRTSRDYGAHNNILGKDLLDPDYPVHSTGAAHPAEAGPARGAEAGALTKAHHEVAKPVHGKAAAAVTGVSGQPRKLLLVVDDSDLTRKMLCRILKAQGYDYDEAEDGAVAVEKVERNIGDCAVMETGAGAGVGTGRNAVVRPYSAILMDFVMPVMDGPKATRKIRAMGCQVPVFGVTGNGQDFDVARFLESGANKVFTKPLDVAAFKECMREAEVAAGGGGTTQPPVPPVIDVLLTACDAH